MLDLAFLPSAMSCVTCSQEVHPWYFTECNGCGHRVWYCLDHKDNAVAQIQAHAITHSAPSQNGKVHRITTRTGHRLDEVCFFDSGGHRTFQAGNSDGGHPDLDKTLEPNEYLVGVAWKSKAAPLGSSIKFFTTARSFKSAGLHDQGHKYVF